MARVPFDPDFAAIRLFPHVDGALFLDIGGNRGLAIDAMLLQSRMCRVISFEPNPGLAAKTREQFTANPRVVVNNVGLGEHEGEFPLYVPVYRGYEYDALASLNPDHARSWLGPDTLFWYREDKLSIKEYRCTVKRLDDLHLNPFFMKLDVQGHELSVLRGAANTIATFHPVLLIEAVEDEAEIMQFLRPFGYRQYRYQAGRFDPDTRGTSNSFFLVEDHLNTMQERNEVAS
jgi:FkbM family methyltransferase